MRGTIAGLFQDSGTLSLPRRAGMIDLQKKSDDRFHLFASRTLFQMHLSVHCIQDRPNRREAVQRGPLL